MVLVHLTCFSGFPPLSDLAGHKHCQDAEGSA